MGRVGWVIGDVGGTGIVSNKKEKDKSEGLKRIRESKRDRRKKERRVTAGELRQSIRLPGPKKLEPGFAE